MRVLGLGRGGLIWVSMICLGFMGLSMEPVGAQQSPTSPRFQPYQQLSPSSQSFQQGLGPRGGGQSGFGRLGQSQFGGGRFGQSGMQSPVQGFGRGGLMQRPESATKVSGETTSTVKTVTGDGGGVRVSGSGAMYEPALEHDLVYGDLPDQGQDVILTLTGPMTATEFLDTLSLTTGWNILVSTGMDTVTLRFWMNEMTPAEAMEILKYHDVFYEYDEETEFLYVMTKDEYLRREYGTISERGFTVKYVAMDDVEALLTTFMSPEGRMIVDGRNSKVLVFDTKDNLDRMERALADVDVTLEPKAFPLIHINVDGISDTVEMLLSERGQMHIDARSNTFVVTDIESRLDEIAKVIEMLDRPLHTRSWTLNYADPFVVAEQVAAIIPEEMGLITVNEDIHQISVRAIESRLDEVDELIEMWDKKRAQVQIEAYLVTASTSVARNLGINWGYYGVRHDGPIAFNVGSGGNPGFEAAGSGQRLSVGQLPAPVPWLNSETGEAILDLNGNEIVRGFMGSEISAVLEYLETSGQVTILAHPRVTVQDGQEAVFENTTNVPFSQSTEQFGSNNNNNFRSVSRIEFISVGTVLRVLPRIAKEGNVLLDVSSEDSSFIERLVTTADQVSTVPEKTQNRAQTQVMVRDQETIVIGGLRTSNFSNDVDKVPLLGDIPLIGRIFRSTTKAHRHTELLIFLTPTIVDENTHPEAIRLAAREDELARAMRQDKKSAFGRAKKWLARNESEIVVAVGQQDDLYADGKLVTVQELRRHFFGVDNTLTSTVVIRKHPRASERIIIELTELAMEADLKVEYDDSSVPFVPALPVEEENGDR